MVEGIPGRGRQAQPTVLVSGGTPEHLRTVSLELFRDRATASDGAVIASARGDPALVSRQLVESAPALDPERISVVDCRDGGSGSSEHPSDYLWNARSPLAFADVETCVESSRLALEERDVRRRHFLFDTLTAQLRLASEPDAVLGHADELATSLGAEEGLTVFVVDAGVLGDRTRERLRHLFDVHVEIRAADDDPEFRWTGLVDRSDGWVRLADMDAPFDSCGTNTG